MTPFYTSLVITSFPGVRKTRLRLNVRGMTPELDRTIKNLTSGGYSVGSGKKMAAVSGSS